MTQDDATAINRLQERIRADEVIIANLERNTRALRDTVFMLVDHLRAGTMPAEEEIVRAQREAVWLSAGTCLPYPHPSL